MSIFWQALWSAVAPSPGFPVSNNIVYNTREMIRSRSAYCIASLGVIALGLGTRPLKTIADELGSALGDAFYAALIYLILAVLFPRLSPITLLISSTIIAWVVEVSQLWHPAWLNSIRQTTPGGLLLGGSFSIGDLGWYLAGTLAVFVVEGKLHSQRSPKKEERK